jgi:hypothetical protein
MPQLLYIKTDVKHISLVMILDICDSLVMKSLGVHKYALRRVL